jgi:hypothetical protein
VKRVILFALLALTCAGGCGPWNAAQSGLTVQARRGVANVVKRNEARHQLINELAMLRRQRVDDAFDQDVREQAPLSPDWVIEHRKAYAAAIDAYARNQADQEAALAAEHRDLAAVDAALERLLWLQSIQSRFDLLGEVADGKR